MKTIIKKYRTTVTILLLSTLLLFGCKEEEECVPVINNTEIPLRITVADRVYCIHGVTNSYTVPFLTWEEIEYGASNSDRIVTEKSYMNDQQPFTCRLTLTKKGVYIRMKSLPVGNDNHLYGALLWPFDAASDRIPIVLLSDESLFYPFLECVDCEIFIPQIKKEGEYQLSFSNPDYSGKMVTSPEVKVDLIYDTPVSVHLTQLDILCAFQ